jgi:hypothetical protein
MFLRSRLLGTLALVSTLLAGCALPAHNNTLIFAVKRDVGVDVSGPTAADPGVSINLGYKERQMAWVPLWANQTTGGFGEKHAMNCYDKGGTSACKQSAKFVGDSDPVGSRTNEANDAYSTFASFGGAINTRVVGNSETIAQADGKLASFFATGVAAQYLAKDTSNYDLVGTKPTQHDTFRPTSATSAEKKLLSDTQSTMKEFFILTETHLTLASTTSSVTVVNTTCLTKLTERIADKKFPDIIWARGRSPTLAAKALIEMGGLNLEQIRTLNAEATMLETESKLVLEDFLKSDRAKAEKEKWLPPTNQVKADKAAEACKPRGTPKT